MSKRTTLRWGKPVAKITAEELHFAMISGDAAYSGRMPMEPVDKRFGPIEVQDQVLVPRDIPINRAAIAILDSLRHDPAKASAALYRNMTIAVNVFKDARSKAWLRVGEDGREEVHPALIEAIATVPVTFGKELPVDRVLRLAERLKAKMIES